MQLVVLVQFLPLFTCPFVFVFILQEPLLFMLILLAKLSNSSPPEVGAKR